MNSANYQLLLSAMNVLYKLCIAVMLVVYALGLVVTTLLVRNMIRPLTALSNTAHEVAKGNLNVPQLPVVVEDEVGIVTRSFNQMLESIRQVDTQPQGEVILLDVVAEGLEIYHMTVRHSDDGRIFLIVEGGDRDTDNLDADVVPEETQIVAVNERTCGLHLNPAERVAHHLHHHAKVGQKFAVLLRLGSTGQHDRVAAVASGKLQTVKVVP